MKSDLLLLKFGFLLPLLVLAPFACDSGPEQSPPVVVIQGSKTGQTVRICPKCHRRFFGDQRSCTVDGSELMDFHGSPAVADSKAGTADVVSNNNTVPVETEAVVAEETPPPVAVEVATKRVPIQVAKSTPNPVSAQPIRVKGKSRQKWERPPTAVASSMPKAVKTATPKPKVAVVVTPPPTPLPTSVPTPKATPTPKAPPPPKVEKVAALPPSQSPEDLLAALFLNGTQSSAQANKGLLTPAQVGALKRVPLAEESDFTKSRLLLATQYKAIGNNKAYGESLNELLKIPGNQYNPTIRLEEAEYYLLKGQWEKAIGAGTTAERYRQKFPRGSVYYSRLARTYEVLAKSYEGRFTSSENPNDLDLAIRMWQRYLTHVEKKTDKKRIKLANEQISKLERIKERVL